MTTTEWIEPVYKEIGERIRLLRARLSLSQRELTERVGDCSQHLLGAWENGSSRIRVSDLLRLCAALEVEPGLLLAELSLEGCHLPPEALAFRHEKARRWRARRGQRTSEDSGAAAAPAGPQRKRAPQRQKPLGAGKKKKRRARA